MSPERFENYSVEDFIIDEEFRNILNSPNADFILNEFIACFPEKEQEAKLAADIIKGLKIFTFKQPTARKKELWQKIINETRNEIH